jgi:hypothetical protein
MPYAAAPMAEYPPGAWECGLPENWVIAVPADGHFLYRVVGNREARLRDFKSWHERDRESGREARFPNDPFIDYVSLSMFETEVLAVESASSFPAYVVRVRLDAENGFSIARTEADIEGHYSVWGDAEKLLGAATAAPSRHEAAR